MNARQRRIAARRSYGIKKMGFITMISDVPPEITRVGQIYETSSGIRFVAIGKSWDTAQWIELKDDVDACEKLGSFLARN